MTKVTYLHDIFHVICRDFSCREFSSGVTGKCGLKLIKDDSSQPGDKKTEMRIKMSLTKVCLFAQTCCSVILQV